MCVGAAHGVHYDLDENPDCKILARYIALPHNNNNNIVITLFNNGNKTDLTTKMRKHSNNKKDSTCTKTTCTK